MTVSVLSEMSGVQIDIVSRPQPTSYDDALKRLDEAYEEISRLRKVKVVFRVPFCIHSYWVFMYECRRPPRPTVCIWEVDTRSLMMRTQKRDLFWLRSLLLSAGQLLSPTVLMNTLRNRSLASSDRDYHGAYILYACVCHSYACYIIWSSSFC